MNTDNDSFDASTTFEVMSIELPPVKNAEHVINDANEKIGAAKFVLNLASDNGLGECEYANALRKNIEDIRTECIQLARCRDDMQLYLENTKLSRRVFYGTKPARRISYGIKKRLNIGSRNPKELDALNTQISKVNTLLQCLEENKNLLYADISKITGGE